MNEQQKQAVAAPVDPEQIMAAGWERAKGLLSYSELTVLPSIMAELQGATEGAVIASKVADAHNTTRSVIVVLLRILEAAGLIKAQSMGMKGTHIRVLYAPLFTEARKLAA
jgi:transcriptional pleiotropic repressor